MSVKSIERGDLWKSGARMLQFQLKQRLRVTVDHHCYRPAIFHGDGYFSSTLQRWLSRFQDFRRDSLPSRTHFYRKRVSKEFHCEEDSVIFRMLQAVAVPVLGNMCHVFMNGLNRVQVIGIEKLHNALLNRPNNKALITVSNHVASVDDPFVLAALLPPRLLLDAQSLRWTLCATDRCFKNPVTSAFFRSVKVLPVARGDGIYQMGMDIAISKLNNGGWVHIFPEGTRSRDGGKTLGSSKRGIGRLVLDADNLPMVVPFVHTGMQKVMPIGASFPRIGQTVTVVVGDPIHFDDLLNAENIKNLPREKLYDAVSSRVGRRLGELKSQVEKFAAEQSTILHSHVQRNSESANTILQVDCDSFGIGGPIFHEDDTSVHANNAYQKNQQQKVDSDKYLRKMFLYDGGSTSRVSTMFLHPTESMGFAAKGFFSNSYSRAKESFSCREMSPLRSWKQFCETKLA